MSYRANTNKENIIKELETLPDEMLPEIARTLTLLKEKYIKMSAPEKIKQLLKSHKKVRAMTTVSKISWATEVKEGRAERI